MGQAVCVEVRLFQVNSIRRSCFSKWLGKDGFVRFVVAITPLSHGTNCRCLPVSKSVPWPDRYVDDLLRVRPPFWHKSPSDCPSSGRFAIRNQDVPTGLHPETDEYTRFNPVFCFRSICQRTHSIPHSFSEHASAHMVSATSAPFEWYFPIRPNCVQVQLGGGVPNHPSNGLRF